MTHPRVCWLRLHGRYRISEAFRYVHATGYYAVSSKHWMHIASQIPACVIAQADEQDASKLEVNHGCKRS